MEHRAVVRRFPLIAAGIMVAASAIAEPGRAKDARADDPTEGLADRPYAIRVWFSVDPTSRVGAREAEALVDNWRVLVSRFVGAAWGIEVLEGEGPLRGRTPGSLVESDVEAAVEGADKGWFLRLEASNTGSGYALSAREFDATTRQLGPLYREQASYPADAPRSLFALTRRVFAPLAEIERTDDGADLLVQGGAIPAPLSGGGVAEPGSVFRPFWIFMASDKSVKEVRSIPFTYLRVGSMTEGNARCDVVSGLRSPLPRRVAGRYRLVALGIAPADVPTRFRFVAGQGENQEPAAGYVLTARGVDDPVAAVVGTTDREGRIVLPPKFSNELVVLRLLAGGIEPLREFPVLPGETPEEREVPVEPRPEAVTLEFRLKALQDRVVDLIARRGRLEAILGVRAEGQAWDEVGALLRQYRELTPRRIFDEELARLTDDARQAQADLGVPVLTRTAQAELAETQSLISRYLDDEAYAAFEDAYRRSQDLPTPADPAAEAVFNRPQAPDNPLVRGAAPAPTESAPAPAPAPEPAPSPPPRPRPGGDSVPF